MYLVTCNRINDSTNQLINADMGMEPEAKELLVKVSKSLAVGLLWLMINMTFGIYLGWLFFGNQMTTGNYIFYGFMIISLVGMIWYLARLWR